VVSSVGAAKVHRCGAQSREPVDLTVLAETIEVSLAAPIAPPLGLISGTLRAQRWTFPDIPVSRTRRGNSHHADRRWSGASTHDSGRVYASRTMKARLGALTALVAMLTFSSLANTPWSLISPQEDARDRAAARTAETRRPEVSGAPVIELLTPDTSRPVRNPVNVDMRFHASPGASMNMNTLRVRYGLLGIDITRRLLRHATVTQNRVFASGVDIPVGRHRLTVSVQDSAARVGSKTFVISIAR
jgi:hypothetical protein